MQLSNYMIQAWPLRVSKAHLDITELDGIENALRDQYKNHK